MDSKSLSDVSEHSTELFYIIYVCVCVKAKLSTLRERKEEQIVAFMAAGYNQNRSSKTGIV